MSDPDPDVVAVRCGFERVVLRCVIWLSVRRVER
jgi:hypothetical protein